MQSTRKRFLLERVYEDTTEKLFVLNVFVYTYINEQ